MSAAFYDDLNTLCHTPVENSHHAEQILDVLAELISDEVMELNNENREFCCKTFLQSRAYNEELLQSRERVVDWLVKTDKLHTQRVLFVGLVLLNDFKSILPFIREYPDSVMAVIDTIWTYRFTQPLIVETFLLIFFEMCVNTEINDSSLESYVSADFVNYLYRCVEEDELSRESLMALVSLNDQYMLHDKRGEDNKVFRVLETSPTRYSAIGSALVLLFNRCGNDDQDLKIFICKFFYLLFTTPATMDLLYTNDLLVLVDIVIRELNDLPLEAVDVRAMYLRLLYAMLKHSSIERDNPKLRGTLTELLRLTISSAENLPNDDRLEINRLAERCLDVPWLVTLPVCDETASDGMQNGESPPTTSSTANNMDSAPLSKTSSNNDCIVDCLTVSPESVPKPPRAKRGPVPPPPPPPPRHHSVASIGSTDSRRSLDTVDHFRPPPPPRRKIH